MRVRWLAIWAPFVVLSADPASADEQGDLSRLSEADLVAQLEDIDAQDADSCVQIVPRYEELNRRDPKSWKYRAGLAWAQINCASQEDRYEDALQLVRQADANLGGTHFDSRALYFAGQLKDGPELLLRLRSLAKSGELAQVSQKSVLQAFDLLVRYGAQSETDEFAYELIASSVFSRLQGFVQESIAVEALRHEVRTGRLGEAEKTLAYVRSPESVQYLLAWRDFEPIWPTVERYAGDNFTKIASSYVSWTASELANKPEDRERIWEYAHALSIANRDDEVISVTQNWLHRDGKSGPPVEGDAWALQVEADTWDRLGERAKADEIYDGLAALPADENPWVVNFVINRQLRLVEQGRWEEALPASELARSVADKYGTDYARTAVAINFGCALYKLGRREEGKRELDFLMSPKADAPAGPLIVLMCAGREREAIAALIPMLSDPSARNAVLAFVQGKRFDLPLIRQPVVPDVGTALRERPELLTEVSKYVRLLPERFIPTANLRLIAADNAAAR